MPAFSACFTMTSATAAIALEEEELYSPKCAVQAYKFPFKAHSRPNLVAPWRIHQNPHLNPAIGKAAE